LTISPTSITLSLVGSLQTPSKNKLRLIDIWEDWIVFPPDFTMELRTRLDGTTAQQEKSEEKVEPVPVEATAMPSRFKTSTFQLATDSAPIAAELDGETVDDVDGEPVDGEPVDGEPVDDIDGDPVDGEPIKDDVDGEAMDDVDGALLEDDVDGAPIVDDVDGQPLEEEDVDGEPMEVES